MAITITSEIIEITKEIISMVVDYDRLVKEEIARSKDVKQSLEEHYKAALREISNTEASMERSIKSSANSDKAEIEKQLKIVFQSEKDLNSRIPRNSVGEISETDECFSDFEVKTTIRKIEETGFSTGLKKMLSIGNYSSNSRMAAELYGKIDGAKRKYSAQLVSIERRYRDRLASIQRTAASKSSQVEIQYQRDIKSEDQVHIAKMRILEQKAQKIVMDEKNSTLRDAVARAMLPTDEENSPWNEYYPTMRVHDNIFLGEFIFPTGIKFPTEETKQLLNKLPLFDRSFDGFSLPLLYSLSSPLCLYADCDDSSIRKAAAIFRSIISRLIRFMPIKGFNSVFFDPVNRGTSLGNLIHLTNNESTGICEYVCSPQDISRKMSALTKHVDDVCHRLASSGCSNIQEYNSLNEKQQIPFTAIIIHDFPCGFDAGSLDQLQVLITKSYECGLFIFISHKRDDKLEYKALDIRDHVDKSFSTITISDYYSPKIRMCEYAWPVRGDLWFKNHETLFSQEALAEILQQYNYRQPLDNSMGILTETQISKRSSKDGLFIPFAIDEDGSILELDIGHNLTAYGFLTGSSGSGKTTMLHTLITSSILHYEPSELELWLVDYKETEFSFYIQNCPPHIRHIVADKSSEITFSIIDEIYQEMMRRLSLFKTIGVKDYAEYRESPYCFEAKLPRILIIIDEFHRMAQAINDESQYKMMLENIFSEVRHTGVTILLSDQFISGLQGLSKKSKDLISVRVAMRSTEEGIRTTLLQEATVIDDSVRQMIANTTAGIEGTAIYKYERAAEKGELSNKVIFKFCRGLHTPKEQRTAIIQELRKQYSSFDREKDIFIGASRQEFCEESITQFEMTHPQQIGEGKRFYVGTPFGIQPCFFFEMKPYSNGENILLVGSNHEKRLSILKSILFSAKKNGYTTTIFASRASQLYRMNRTFFSSISDVKVVTAFPDICRAIGLKANQINSLYSDDYEEDDTDDAMNQDLFVFVGLDDMYSQMEASLNTQKTAWAALTHDVPTAEDDLQESSNSKEQVSNPLPHSTPSKAEPRTDFTNYLRQLDSIQSRNAQISGGVDEKSITITEKFAGANCGGLKGYNAISDLMTVISLGWKIGINSAVVVDSGSAFSRMRGIKLDGNFNHRIAMEMSPEEARSFMTKSRVLKSLIHTNDTISAVYEYMGERERCFRPFKFQ